MGKLGWKRRRGGSKEGRKERNEQGREEGIEEVRE